MCVSGYGARARGQALNEVHLLCCRALVAVSAERDPKRPRSQIASSSWWIAMRWGSDSRAAVSSTPRPSA